MHSGFVSRALGFESDVDDQDAGYRIMESGLALPLNSGSSRLRFRLFLAFQPL